MVADENVLARKSLSHKVFRVNCAWNERIGCHDHLFMLGARRYVSYFDPVCAASGRMFLDPVDIPVHPAL